MVAQPVSTPFTRPSSSPFAKDMCFFCQKVDPKNEIHEATSNSVGMKLKKAVDLYGSDILKVQLSTAIDPSDAHAIDVKYHKKCWMMHVENPLLRGKRDSGTQNETQRSVAAEIEFL